MPSLATARDTPAHRHLSPSATARLLGDWRAGGPAYAALADGLRSAVLAGTVAPNTRLPSERDLAAALGVSRTTATAAYRQLREQGFARSRTGSGTVAVLPHGTTARRGTTQPGGDAPAAIAPPTDADPIDLSQATPAAPSALHGAYSSALERMPAHLAGGGYAPFGIAELRQAIADRYSDRGVPTSIDQILVTSGCQHAIAMLARTVLGAGDRVVVQSPTYYHGMDALRGAGGRLVAVPVGGGGGGENDGDGRLPGFDVEVFESAVRQVAPRLAYLVPDFHNPTGYSFTAEERERVRNVAARHRVTVVGDETLTDLALDPGADIRDPFAGDGRSAFVVSVGSASKAYWGGLRVGWVRAHPDLVAHLARTRQSVDISSATLEQLVVVELLARGDDVLAERRAVLREQRDLLCGLLTEAFPEWTVRTPPGGPTLWVGLGGPLAHAVAAAAAAEGVVVNAGPTFTPDGSARDHLRITFARSAADIERAVPRLAAAWDRVRGRAARPSR